MPITKKLITVPLKKLIPYEQNTKIHTDNVEEIAKSIQRNEYITPIIADEEYIILAGHGRKLALEHLGEKKTQVIQVKGLSEEQKKDFRISDNKIAELSEWNIDMLQIELKGVSLELQKLFPDIVLEDIELDEDTKEIIIAWENEVSRWLENGGSSDTLYVKYTGPHAITRMLIDLKYIRTESF